MCLSTESRNSPHSSPNQGFWPMEGAAGLGSASYDVSLLSPFSYIHNTVGCFNYSPSVGESKPLQRHTLIPPPFFLFSLQGTHCLLNIISLSSTHTIGLKCGSFAKGGGFGDADGDGSGGGQREGIARWGGQVGGGNLGIQA